jgi:hypothetical protein
MLQLPQGKPDFVFQHDGTPPHIHSEVTVFFNRHLPERWIGRVGRFEPLDFFPVGLCER